ncbi:vitamin D3 receptor B-like [Mya arenaria]|uniref:vitamin D3 receptor B-like n=1 Tax=Mya arenaria TaxID=6604 RepID=UPI0022E4C9B7|nr:vitamin D3 receptor B-like [Mya arenaria]
MDFAPLLRDILPEYADDSFGTSLSSVQEADDSFSASFASLPEADDNAFPDPDDSFMSLLAEHDDSENFGLSLIENNHDLFDLMAPLMDPTPFSPFPCDDIEVLGDTYTELNQHQTFEDTDQTDQASPLRQLLLSKSKMRESSEFEDETQIDSPKSRKSKRSKSRRQAREQKTRRDSLLMTREPEVIQQAESPKEKFISKALKFPPCAVCGGNASGLHYGVNSCEACKGFFRRYIIRNEEYKCIKGGNCKVVNKNRENCSGCRLKKCLDLGMSKQNSKLGRYSLSRRTETIKKVKILEGKVINQKKEKTVPVPENPFKFDHTYSGLGQYKSSPGLEGLVSEDCSPDAIIEDLVNAMDNIQPYGPTITTQDEIQTIIGYHQQRYKSKLEVYGEMKAVPRDEYYQLLKDYGIDIDGRIKVFKEYVLKIKRMSERYYNFASQIPGFTKLDSHDQSNLLNASRCDFFITLMHEGYSAEYDILLARNGVAYHVEELADKCFSRTLIKMITQAYHRIQKLELTKEEKALLVALTLVFTDRCRIENRDLVDKMQYLISELIRYQLERTSGQNSYSRFAKFTDCLVYLRDVAELYWQEYRQLCKDDVIVEHVPMVKEFLADEW